MDETVAKAVEVLGTPEKAYRWLLAPNRALSGITPFSILETVEGRATVNSILTRIEYGIFS